MAKKDTGRGDMGTIADAIAPAAPMDEVERSRQVAAAQDARDGKPKTPEERAAAKRANFCRLAPKRVQNVIEALRRLRQTTSPAGYDFTDEQAAKVIKAVTYAVDECFAAFSRKSKKDDLFTL